MKPAASFTRARSPEHKQRRIDDLLASARALATADGVRTLTLGAIADHGGIHISGVRRYFDSREDILLHIAAQEWTAWAAEVAQRLARRRPPLGARRLANLLAESMQARPLFCDLLAHAPVTLEREVPEASVRDYKRAALDAAAQLTTALRRATPELTEPAARDLVAATTALSATLWQTAHPGPTLARLYREDPSLAHAQFEFAPRLAAILDALITGLKSGRS